jgi:hypothetical protein
VSSGSSGYTPASGIYPLNAKKSSIATFYGGNWEGGMCMFDGYNHGDLPGIALGKQQWFGGAGCGACVQITGKAGTVVAMIADQVNTGTFLDLAHG